MHILAKRMLGIKFFVVLSAGCLASPSSSEQYAADEPEQSQDEQSNPTLLGSASPQVVYRLYTSPNTDPVFVDPANTTTLATFNLSVCCTVFCVHGYKGDAKTNSGCYNISQAFLNRSPCNVITVDWSQLDDGSYIDNVLVKIQQVSDRMAEMVNSVLSIGARSSCIHLVGHSLGAHISAFTCRKAKEPCGWLTGLDPAGPMFFCANANCRFNASDCVFNEAIHTSKTFGTFQAVAQCDLLVNRGVQPFTLSPQPGCVNDVSGLCAHFYAITLYVYAIQNSKALVAKKCVTFPSLPNTCSTVECIPDLSRDETYIGPLVDKTCKGVYNVNTKVPKQEYQPNVLNFLDQGSIPASSILSILENGTCYLKV
ncbi:hypothetical protein ONE63_007349 [Megalurothrips usitatus]|uniref:Lipase domain-containing protein n=1 Tax=Megalurothrips usitatus TaxID=439358 RepID=A0AAV7XZA3_9NEOP|nr:hypothetical protein ONE63_007349 [Megalurothrips usitatus]